VKTFLLLGVLISIGCAGEGTEVPADPADTGVSPDAGQELRDSERPTDTALAEVAVTECPKELASARTVTFAITNKSSADRWLVLRGAFCTPFSVEGLDLELGWQCGCECPNPGSPRVESYRRVPAGATYELVWDARRLLTCEESLDCSSWGPTAMPVKMTRGMHQPAPSGTYSAAISFEESVPTKCSVSGDDASCPWSYGGGTSALPRAIASRCESTKTATVSFTLPASGNVVVPVTIE